MAERNFSIMTPRQARLAVRSLAYRRRLMEGVPQIEAELKAYLKTGEGRTSHGSKNPNTALLGGFLVKLKEDELILEELEPLEYDQLEFEFLKEPDLC